MSSGVKGVIWVSIPINVKKTINNIKEFTGQNHSEDDIQCSRNAPWIPTRLRLLLESLASAGESNGIPCFMVEMRIIFLIEQYIVLMFDCMKSSEQSDKCSVNFNRCIHEVKREDIGEKWYYLPSDFISFHIVLPFE